MCGLSAPLAAASRRGTRGQSPGLTKDRTDPPTGIDAVVPTTGALAGSHSLVYVAPLPAGLHSSRALIMRLCRPLIRLMELAGFLFHSDLQRFFFRDLLFRGVLPYVFSDFHGTEVRSTHAAEVSGFRSFLRESLTKLMPIIFARSFASLPVYVASSRSAPFIVELE